MRSTSFTIEDATGASYSAVNSSSVRIVATPTRYDALVAMARRVRRRVTPVRWQLPLRRVDATGQVLHARIDLDRDHPPVRAEAAGDRQRGEQVGARRRAREDAFGAGGAAGHREGVLRRHSDHVVDVRR